MTEFKVGDLVRLNGKWACRSGIISRISPPMSVDGRIDVLVWVCWVDGKRDSMFSNNLKKVCND